MHYQFEAIHPFSDGNGRTGRILNVLYLKPRGLLDAPIIYVSRYFMAHRSTYYRLLRAVTEQGDWQARVRYILTAVEESATDAISRIRHIQTLAQEMSERAREATRAANGDAAATIAAGVVEQSGHQHAVRAQQVSLASRCPRFVAIHTP